MNTDEELYARFLCGEDDAIRQLMDRYLERLTLFCFTFLHSLTEAEDMALDAFAVVAMKRSDLVWRQFSALAVPHCPQPFHLPLPQASGGSGSL